jgi:hypothetical protein
VHFFIDGVEQRQDLNLQHAVDKIVIEAIAINSNVDDHYNQKKKKRLEFLGFFSECALLQMLHR